MLIKPNKRWTIFSVHRIQKHIKLILYFLYLTWKVISSFIQWKVCAALHIMSALIHSGILLNSSTLVELSLSTINIFKSVVLKPHCPLPLKKAFSFFICSLLLRQKDNEAIENADMIQISSHLLTNLKDEALITGTFHV